MVPPVSANALTILVVDDDEGTRELLRDALRMNGYQAILASVGCRVVFVSSR